ncbi:AT-hook motif nuclear-localized protein 1-like [Pyrus communis]|uniref:AT-hook motif nuclear-localized protein 1-like n=1 Tax=Pyrus communis TaxID=23211 RepID=UPI0035C0004F
MEEKESTFSGSPGNSETESLPVTQKVSMPMAALAAVDATVSSEENYNNTPVSETTQVAEVAAAASVGPGDLSGKKKRGRPRKYDADGNLRPGYNSNKKSNKGGAVPPPPPGFYLSSPLSSEFSFSSKRGRGKPSGSGNYQILASLGELFANTAGGDFTPHVVNVSTGEDVASKIFSISHKGRGVCVLSANGAVSNVTIRQPGSSGGILTYEGRFELLSLSGSFTVTEIGGVRSRTGGLSVSLAGPDGRVIGGGIAGVLTAASPIQIVVGSFMPNGYKAHKVRKHYRENTVGSPISSAPNTVTAATPVSQAQPETESRLNAISPLPAHSHGGEANKSMIQMHGTSVVSTNAGWNGADLKSEHRPSPDINLSVPGVSVTGA